MIGLIDEIIAGIDDRSSTDTTFMMEFINAWWASYTNFIIPKLRTCMKSTYADVELNSILDSIDRTMKTIRSSIKKMMGNIDVITYEFIKIRTVAELTDRAVIDELTSIKNELIATPIEIEFFRFVMN